MFRLTSFILSPLIILVLTLFPIQPAGRISDKAFPVFEKLVAVNDEHTETEEDSLYIELIYDSLGLKKSGLKKEAFTYAYTGYKKLLESGSLNRKDILTICDFSQSSRRKRLYVIDLEQQKVLLNTYVAHGRNSGTEYARKFSNKPESRQSSLGFYKTKKTYYGNYGLALTLSGLEAGINDKAERRKIVLHGSDYIGDNFLRYSRYMGRSFGCPAVPKKYVNRLINTIKNGTCLFIYHPSKRYLEGSKILNS